ncbi:hypothetical protein [Streptomyces sp. NPDC002788]
MINRTGAGSRAADGVGGAGEKAAGSGRPTSRDVARLAGVSHTAVSFVFNGRAQGNLSPATTRCPPSSPPNAPAAVRRPG